MTRFTLRVGAATLVIHHGLPLSISPAGRYGTILPQGEETLTRPYDFLFTRRNPKAHAFPRAK